jgi:hypothetical protein
MEAILIVIGLVAFGVAAQEWGTDSRPVVADTHTDPVPSPRWFPF